MLGACDVFLTKSLEFVNEAKDAVFFAAFRTAQHHALSGDATEH